MTWLREWSAKVRTAVYLLVMCYQSDILPTALSVRYCSAIMADEKPTDPRVLANSELINIPVPVRLRESERAFIEEARIVSGTLGETQSLSRFLIVAALEKSENALHRSFLEYVAERYSKK